MKTHPESVNRYREKSPWNERLCAKNIWSRDSGTEEIGSPAYSQLIGTPKCDNTVGAISRTCTGRVSCEYSVA